MEKKAIEKKMKIYTGILAVFFMVLIGRLAFMQIIQAGRYQTLATQNHQRLIAVEAPRGEIIDRNGIRIVSNKPVYTVSLVYLGLEDSDLVVKRLSALLVGDDNFPGMDVQQIEQDIQNKIKGHTRLYEPVRVAVDVSQDTINKIEEHRLELPGVNIDIEPVRYYPYKDLLGEVLGYVREITGDELDAHKDDGYEMGDSFGQVGLENTYENYLRGVNGARQVEVDAQGRPVRDLGLKPPVPGNNLILTIDSRLQRVAQDAVAEAVQKARTTYAKVPTGSSLDGAAVVTDVNTGEVLAMATIPSFDLNIFSGPLPASTYNELLSDGALRNHAIQSIYSPGSTFKMATATALLEGKIVTPQDTISDPGYYKYKKDWKPGGHGMVNIIKAIKVSCDTFFYMFGAQAGPDLIDKYATQYGFGQLTGIDLPGEEPGRLASRELKKKMWAGNQWESQWHEYDSMDMAIGQQETRVTPMQLADYVTAIANGGTLYQPHLVKKVVSPDGVDIMTFNPKVIRKLDVSQDTLDVIRQGMHEATMGEGTASGVFWGAPYTAAAKTGTAEVGDVSKNNQSLFVAFAPYEKPEIAISVIIEFGGHGGSTAGPAARQIMDAYFQLKKDDAMGKQDQDILSPDQNLLGQNQDSQSQNQSSQPQTPAPAPSGQGSGQGVNKSASGGPVGAEGNSQQAVQPVGGIIPPPENIQKQTEPGNNNNTTVPPPGSTASPGGESGAGNTGQGPAGGKSPPGTGQAGQ